MKHQPSRPSRRSSPALASCLLLTIASPLTLCGCGRGGTTTVEGAGIPAALETPAAEEVSTAFVERRPVTTTLAASGSVIAPRTTALGPEVGGRLQRVNVDVGDTVSRGEPVFEIDPEPYRVAHSEAEAGLELARAELGQAEQELQRTTRLAAESVVAQQEKERNMTRVAVARAQVAAAAARVERAADNLERTVTRAPYDAHVVARHLHEGAIVTVGPSAVVVTLQERGRLEAVLDVPEASRVHVATGDPVRLVVEGLPDPVLAEVRAVNARLDTETRTYEVRVAMPDLGTAAKSGSFVRAEITPRPRHQGLAVPRDAILLRDGRAHVFRLAGEQVAEVEVRLGVTGPEWAEVLEGLDEGDEVVVGAALQRLADGSRVVRTAAAAGSEG